MTNESGFVETYGARLEVFDPAAHMLSLEQPDCFNAVLRDFLDSAG